MLSKCKPVVCTVWSLDLGYTRHNSEEYPIRKGEMNFDKKRIHEIQSLSNTNIST